MARAVRYPLSVPVVTIVNFEAVAASVCPCPAVLKVRSNSPAWALNSAAAGDSRVKIGKMNFIAGIAYSQIQDLATDQFVGAESRTIIPTFCDLIALPHSSYILRECLGGFFFPLHLQAGTIFRTKKFPPTHLKYALASRALVAGVQDDP